MFMTLPPTPHWYSRSLDRTADFSHSWRFSKFVDSDKDQTNIERSLKSKNAILFSILLCSCARSYKNKCATTISSIKSQSPRHERAHRRQRNLSYPNPSTAFRAWSYTQALYLTLLDESRSKFRPYSKYFLLYVHFRTVSAKTINSFLFKTILLIRSLFQNS